MSEPNCLNCRFSRAPGSNSGAGDEHLECRRHAPRANVGPLREGDAAFAWFPLVLECEWCAVYEPGEPETVSEAAAELARLVLSGQRSAAYGLIDQLQQEREGAA